MQEGLFITLEGVDGVGKSTQAHFLKEFLEKEGHRVRHTFQPGGTELGSQIRDLLLNPAHSELQEKAEILLYAADRAQHVFEIIRPALQRSETVICERFTDSSIAYQGYGLGLDVEMVKTINRWATAGLDPDLTIYLDAEPSLSLQKTKGDRIEQRTVDYYTRVRYGYLEIAKAEPERVMVVPASGTREEVAERVIEAFRGRLGL
ncbi:MAG: dTMP kinase [Firmicutes bacterium]|nr:dTMP kinase [Bacillota bacterium]